MSKDNIDGWILKAAELETENVKLRAALEQYADKKNWRVSDSSSGFLDKWIDDDGPTIAQAALTPRQPEGGKE